MAVLESLLNEKKWKFLKCTKKWTHIFFRFSNGSFVYESPLKVIEYVTILINYILIVNYFRYTIVILIVGYIIFTYIYNCDFNCEL